MGVRRFVQKQGRVGRVPRFASLRDFVCARNRVWSDFYEIVCPGPERDDLEERMRRHGYFRPGFWSHRVRISRT